MKFFLLGVIAALGCIAAGAAIYLQFGFLSFSADERPSAFESQLAMSAVDASMKRRAPGAKNPVDPNEANLLEGLKLYRLNCALCHGDPGQPERVLGSSFYPPAPQFMKEPADMPPAENFQIIKHGIAWTAMPAWATSLSDDQVWKLTTFLAQMDKLPPAVDQGWKKAASAEVKGDASGTVKPPAPMKPM
jgi:mono/diheme cytochrome c family protein